MQYSCEINKIYKADVLVVGGGPAGFGAAVAAARAGADTLLIEQQFVLGGMSTSGLVGPFMTCYDDDCTEQIVKGIFDELCVRTEKKGGAIHPSKITGMSTYNSYYIRSHEHVTPYQSEILAVTMDEMVKEAGVRVLFGARLLDVQKEDGKIIKAIISLKEGLAAVEASCYIDCTGDADLAVRAGVPTVFGDKERGTITPSTLFFEVGNIDREAFVAELEANKDKLDNHMANCYAWYVAEAKKNGDWTLDRNEVGMYEQLIPGRFKVNTTRMAGVDCTDSAQITEAMMEGRRQVQEVFAFMKKYLPGCKDVELLQVASHLGVRETRHIEGEYVLTTDDIMNRTPFEDAVLTFAYALDIHLPEGGGVEFTTVNHSYTIPYRCMLPKNCENLLVAGRSISGTSEAAASYRVMPACVALGEAAGIAAAMAASAGIGPKEVDTKILREKLLAAGAVI